MKIKKLDDKPKETAKDAKATNRSRKIKFFLDKMKAQENQTDSIAKLVKDLVVRKALVWMKAVAPIVGLVLLLLVLVVAMVAVPVIAVIAILYNSPLSFEKIPDLHSKWYRLQKVRLKSNLLRSVFFFLTNLNINIIIINENMKSQKRKQNKA